MSNAEEKSRAAPDAKCADVCLDAKTEASLRRYAELLASYERARLTGSHDAAELYDVHIRDCLYSTPYLPASGRVIDVGSGGGLPGIVWAVMRPDLEVTLLDSVRKKVTAMQDIALQLGLTNVRAVWGRCEEHALHARESYELASARALASTGVIAEYLSPLVKIGSTLLAFKGPKAAEELRDVGNKWARLGLSDPEIVPYGPTDRHYSFIIWHKKAACPAVYPRKSGTALVKGWWM